MERMQGTAPPKVHFKVRGIGLACGKNSKHADPDTSKVTCGKCRQTAHYDAATRVGREQKMRDELAKRIKRNGNGQHPPAPTTPKPETAEEEQAREVAEGEAYTIDTAIRDMHKAEAAYHTKAVELAEAKDARASARAKVRQVRARGKTAAR